MIAGALVMDPELIVADEPVSMLDVSIRTELLRLMLDLRRERGLTYLFITHDLSLAWVLADRIAVMYLGRIMEIGPAEQVIRSPRNPYTQALVSVSPSPDPPEVGGQRERGRSSSARRRTRSTSRPAAGSTRAARSRSTGAATEEPPLIEVAEGHLAACWLAEAGPRDLPILDAVVQDPASVAAIEHAEAPPAG